jgi:MFS family permease
MKALNHAEISAGYQPTLWLPLCALALVYGMFTLGWMVYRVHLPSQMTQAGFSEAAAPRLLFIEALLAITVEPLAGAFSDRTNRHQGTRLPIISTGMGLAAVLFIVFSAFTWAEPTIAIRWVLVSLLVIWSIAMGCFRSPALALLKRYAPTLKLPQAASLLTVAFGLAGAATPLATPWVLNLGLPMSFTLMALLIVLSALWLRRMNPDTLVAAKPTESLNSTQPRSTVALTRIVGLGFTSALAFRLAIEIFPKVLKAQVPGIYPPLLVGLVFITVAIAAFPIGKFAVRLGNSRTMQLGVVSTALFLGLMALSHSSMSGIMVALGLGVGFSLILNGTLPFTLEQVPPEHAGLGIGLFFAGVATAGSLMMGFLGKPGVLLPAEAIILGIGALLGVAFCIGSRQHESA